jgi:hypothetical protein
MHGTEDVIQPDEKVSVLQIRVPAYFDAWLHHLFHRNV